MKGLNSISDPGYLKIQKRIVAAFEDLKQTTESLGSRTRQLGWKQRNVLVDHVYSDYQKHEELNAARKEWEEVSREYNVHRKLYELMREYRNLYGYFPKYPKLFTQLNGIIALAVAQEEFEIAGILEKWKQKMSEKSELKRRR